VLIVPALFVMVERLSGRDKAGKVINEPVSDGDGA
jgi:hypothetical protein